MAKRSYGGASKPSLNELLLVEALGRSAAPEVVERIVRLALHEAGLGEVPRDPAAFGSFACGPLHATVVEALGDDWADAVVADLQPAFVDAEEKPDSAVRRRGRRSAESPSPDAPVLVIATKARAIADSIAARLGDRVKLVYADDVFGVLQSAQRYGGTSLMMVVHDEMPAIGKRTLVTLARLLPSSAIVVQFGRLETAAPQPEGDEELPTWYSLGPVADPDAIADVLLAVLPDSSARPRVVLAHTDVAYRQRVADELRAAGYEVSEAADGVVALEMCEPDPPQVVLAPPSLPGMGGLQMAALLESRDGPVPYFVLLSSDAPLEMPNGVATLVSEEGDLVEVVRMFVPVDA